jgi:malate dehydrogenase (oxaloacetate-decarboxylating)(NADP+)
MLDNPYFDDHWQMYHHLLERKGISPSYAQGVVRSRPTVYGALMLKQGQADGMIVGSVGRYHRHLAHINDVIGSHDTVKGFSSMNVLVSDKGTYFICDTAVHNNPTAEEVKDITLLAAKKVKQFGVEPKVALLSTSNFGTFNHQDAVKMQQALRLIHDEAPDLEVEGEMQMETALDSKVRGRLFPNSLLVGEANLFIMPNLDAATISFDFAKHMIDGQNIGPILLGSRLPVHIITPSMKVRDILNMAAICSVDAGI